MNNLENLSKEIKRLNQILYSKEAEVIFVFRGTELGQDNPWLVKCADRESHATTAELAANELFLLLKKELKNRIDFNERATDQLKSVYQKLSAN